MEKFKASLYAWNGMTLFFGVIPDNHEHAHHLIQIIIGLNRDFKITSSKGTYDSRYAIVAPDEPHFVDDYNDWQVMIHIDPETVVGQHLKKQFFNVEKVVNFEFNLIEPFIDELQSFKESIHTCREATRLVDNILVSLTGNPIQQHILDPRIQKAIDTLKQVPLKKMSTKVLASSVCLSEGRLTHLFKEQVGIPIRRYLMWLRITDALLIISTGASFTEAAHHAGFADHAHLSRTYRNMYGMRLSDVLKNIQSVQTIFCYH